MNHMPEQMLQRNLTVLWAIGLPVTYTVASTVDDKGEVQELVSLTSDALREAEFSSYDKQAVAQHLDNLLYQKLAVVKLLGKEIVLRPLYALVIKKELKEKLGLDLDTVNSYLINESDYQHKGNVACGVEPVITIHADGIKALVEVYDALNARDIGLLSMSFSNVSPDELKACLDVS